MLLCPVPDKDILLHNVAHSMKLSLSGTDLKKGQVVHDGQDGFRAGQRL